MAIGLSLYFHFAASESKDSTIGRRKPGSSIPFTYLQRRPLLKGCSNQSSYEGPPPKSLPPTLALV